MRRTRKDDNHYQNRLDNFYSFVQLLIAIVVLLIVSLALWKTVASPEPAVQQGEFTLAALGAAGTHFCEIDKILPASSVLAAFALFIQ